MKLTKNEEILAELGDKLLNKIKTLKDEVKELESFIEDTKKDYGELYKSQKKFFKAFLIKFYNKIDNLEKEYEKRNKAKKNKKTK